MSALKRLVNAPAFHLFAISLMFMPLVLNLANLTRVRSNDSSSSLSSSSDSAAVRHLPRRSVTSGDIQVVNESDWLVQFHVMQKTAIVVREERDRVFATVETLVFLHADALRGNNKTNSLRCLVWRSADAQDRVFVLKASAVRYVHSEVAIWHLKFRLPLLDSNNSTYDDDTFKVAVVDQDELAKRRTEFGAEWLRVAFQRALYFDKASSRRPSVAHCVHCVRDLHQNRKFERLRDWLDVQHALGFAQITLQFSDVRAADEPRVQELTRRHASSLGDGETPFVRVLKFKTSVADNCEWLRTQRSALFNNLRENLIVFNHFIRILSLIYF